MTGEPVDVTWSAHHASQKKGKPFEVSITSLLPLLRDQAHSWLLYSQACDGKDQGDSGIS